MRAKQYTEREFKKVLKQNGYKPDRWKGSHEIWINEKGNVISINKNPNTMVCRRLIKENNLNLN